MKEEKYKICMITRATLEHGIGGMEDHINNLVNGLRKKGHQVWILTRELPNHNNKKNRFTITVPNTEDPRKMWNFEKNMYTTFREYDNKIRFDIIHFQSTTGTFLLPFINENKRRLVITFHGTPRSEGFLEPSKYSKFSKIEKIFATIYFSILPKFFMETPYMDHIIAMSYRTQWSLLVDYPKLKERIAIIDAAIDTKKFTDRNKNILKANYNLEGKIVLLFVGRLNKTKGPQDLVEIAPILIKIYNNIKIIILGGGPFIDELKMTVKKRGLSETVEILGRVSYEDLYNYYALADIFINPSHIREAFGLVTAEAMCSGTLTIVSPLAAHKGMIKNNKTAIICDTKNSELLSNQILKILNNPIKFEKIRINGMNHIRNNFSLNSMVIKTDFIYKKVMNTAPNKDRIKKKSLLFLKILPTGFFLLFYNYFWFYIKPKIAIQLRRKGRIIGG